MAGGIRRLAVFRSWHPLEAGYLTLIYRTARHTLAMIYSGKGVHWGSTAERLSGVHQKTDQCEIVVLCEKA